MSQLQKALKAADEDRASEQALREAAEDELTRCRGALKDEIAEQGASPHMLLNVGFCVLSEADRTRLAPPGRYCCI